jgi:hypothetical protein
MNRKSIYSAAVIMALTLSGQSFAGNGGGGMGMGGAAHRAGGNATPASQTANPWRSDQALQQERDREQYRAPGERESQKRKARYFGEGSVGDVTPDSRDRDRDLLQQQDRVRDPSTHD